MRCHRQLVEQQARQQVVCHRDGPRLKSVAELASLDLRVVGDSGFVERLYALQAAQASGPDYS